MRKTHKVIILKCKHNVRSNVMETNIYVNRSNRSARNRPYNHKKDELRID
jgi:hypothetical protein